MLSKWGRTWISKLWMPLVQLLLRLHITPNMLTLMGLVFGLLAGIPIATGNLLAGAALYVTANLFDSLDGELARLGQMETRLGPFLDSVCDHLGDFSVYLGLLWFYMRQEGHLTALLVFIAMFGSVFGSHVRSRAGMAGIDTKEIGAFTRLERMIVLVLGILFHLEAIALGILAFFTLFSSLQRIIYTVRLISQNSPVQSSQE